MASVQEKGHLIKFSSLPNFRNLTATYGTKDDANEDQRSLESSVVSLNLYRSSRPDFLTEDEVNSFLKLGIRSIIDLRSVSEYHRASGPKLLDNFYPLYKVLGTSMEDSVKYVPVTEPALSIRKHFLISFFGINYIMAMLYRAPWSIVPRLLFWVIVDLFKRTGFKHCMRTFTRVVLNEGGLYGLYVDFLTHSQGAICAALRLLCDRQNLPAMLNCAHGKDRTGIVTALVLSCVGVDKEAIATDYAASEHGLNSIRDRVNQEFAYIHASRLFTTARSETMMRILEYLDEKYGSAGGYLESIGFCAREQLQLRNSILS